MKLCWVPLCVGLTMLFSSTVMVCYIVLFDEPFGGPLERIAFKMLILGLTIIAPGVVVGLRGSK